MIPRAPSGVLFCFRALASHVPSVEDFALYRGSKRVFVEAKTAFAPAPSTTKRSWTTHKARGQPPSCLVRGPGTIRCAGPGSERRLRSREHSLFRTPPPRFPPWRHGCLAVDWLREAGILQQCRASGAELLLLAWRVSNGHWRFFVVVLRLLDPDQKRALRTSHLRETPEDLPKEYCLGHAGQEVVDVQGLNAALRRGFAATASLESSDSEESD